ncbi:MAG: hypothetical protein RSO15_11705 [Bacteroides sp.]|uniref:hypothetical protein n=1 Tax=Bacteroides sp. TaxID=29523 RepID=UPI002FCB9002
MKQLLVALMLATVLPLFGQTPQEITSITFYGVDYSLVRVYGASESPTQFRTAFAAINDLFITEPKKYDISKFTGKKLDEISLDGVNRVNRKINLHDLITTTPDYTPDAAQILQVVRRLYIEKKTSSTGAVVVAKLLSKADNRGTYELVYFDVATRKIIDSIALSGKAGGFGLRNFWAGSLYKALKDLR